MDKISSVLVFSIFIVGLMVAIISIYLRYERRGKKKLKEKFRTFTRNIDFPQSDLRAVPRISIPPSIEVVLTINDNKNKTLNFFVLDVSLSGFLVEPDFSPKKLLADSVLERVTITTPINRFMVNKIKLLRMEQRLKKRVMAFNIQEIDEDQFEELKMFIKFLDKFLENGT